MSTWMLIKEGLHSKNVLSPQVYRLINSICRWPFSFLGSSQRNKNALLWWAPALRTKSTPQGSFTRRWLGLGVQWFTGAKSPFSCTAHPAQDPNLDSTFHYMSWISRGHLRKSKPGRLTVPRPRLRCATQLHSPGRASRASLSSSSPTWDRFLKTSFLPNYIYLAFMHTVS